MKNYTAFLKSIELAAGNWLLAATSIKIVVKIKNLSDRRNLFLLIIQKGTLMFNEIYRFEKDSSLRVESC